MAGGGVGEAMLLGAAMGGGSAAITGGDPLKGALLGGLTGGAGAGISGALGGAGTAAGTAAGSTAGSAAGTAAGTGAGITATAQLRLLRLLRFPACWVRLTTPSLPVPPARVLDLLLPAQSVLVSRASILPLRRKRSLRRWQPDPAWPVTRWRTSRPIHSLLVRLRWLVQLVGKSRQTYPVTMKAP